MPGPLVVKVASRTERRGRRTCHLHRHLARAPTFPSLRTHLRAWRDAKCPTTPRTPGTSPSGRVVADGEPMACSTSTVLPIGRRSRRVAAHSRAGLSVIVSVNRRGRRRAAPDLKGPVEGPRTRECGDLSRPPHPARESAIVRSAPRPRRRASLRAHHGVPDKTDSPARRPARARSDRMGAYPSRRPGPATRIHPRDLWAVRQRSTSEGRARSDVAPLGTSSLSLAVMSVGRSAPPAAESVSGLTQDLEALSRRLPGRGRAAYKFIRPRPKKPSADRRQAYGARPDRQAGRDLRGRRRRTQRHHHERPGSARRGSRQRCGRCAETHAPLNLYRPQFEHPEHVSWPRASSDRPAGGAGSVLQGAPRTGGCSMLER